MSSDKIKFLTFSRYDSEPGAIALDPYGWVATTNARPEDESQKAIEYNSNLKRLQEQALEEIKFFREHGMADLLDEHASHAALVSRMNRMYIHHLSTSWVPRTVVKLHEECRKVAFEHAKLGMPAAHEDKEVHARRLKMIVSQVVDRVLSVPLLYTRDVR